MLESKLTGNWSVKKMRVLGVISPNHGKCVAWGLYRGLSWPTFLWISPTTSSYGMTGDRPWMGIYGGHKSWNLYPYMFEDCRLVVLESCTSTKEITPFHVGFGHYPPLSQSLDTLIVSLGNCLTYKQSGTPHDQMVEEFPFRTCTKVMLWIFNLQVQETYTWKACRVMDFGSTCS